MGLNAGDELVDVVDESDQIIQTVPRRVMRADHLRHRAVFIAILDGAGRLLVHRRSPHKDVWPSWCDIAVGGVVGAGESYLEAARRELAEEVGINQVDLIELDPVMSRPYEDDQVSLMARCYVLKDHSHLMMVKWLRLGGCIVTVLMTCYSAKSFFLTVWLYFSL